MGFLKNGGFGKRDGLPGIEAGGIPEPAGANGMAVKMGKLIGRQPGEVSDFAARLGTGMNMIAAGGGADPGYGGPAPMQEAAPMRNIMQQFDPRMMNLFMRNFQGGRF